MIKVKKHGASAAFIAIFQDLQGEKSPSNTMNQRSSSRIGSGTRLGI